MELEAGTVVANRYRIIRPLGRGGMGEVFAAENIRTGRQVAIKLLRSDSKSKSSAVARFKREARAAGSINSDHVTQVLDVEEDAEHGIVLVFELLEGESLIDRLRRTGPLDFEELHPIIEQVWMGLADAHRAGIIHRDLKPSNVFLEQRPDGSTRVKILDFGISKLPKEMGGETLTEMGQSLGTFSFMPPEQIGKAKTVDHRADIYACATLIYQAMTGQLPYQARNILIMVEMKTKTEARKLADALDGPIDPRLEAFLARGLARDPAQRFQSALEGLNAWRELRPQGIQSGPRTPHGRMISSTPSSGIPSQPPGMQAMQPAHTHAGSFTPANTMALVHPGPASALPPEAHVPANPDTSETVMRVHAEHEPMPPPVHEAPTYLSEAPAQYAPSNYQAMQPVRRMGPNGTTLLEPSQDGSLQPVHPYPARPVSSHQLPIIYEDSSSGAQSQETTHIYKQPQPSAAPAPYPEPIAPSAPPELEPLMAAPIEPFQPQPSKHIAVVIAAVFVSLVLTLGLTLWSMGKLPWQ